MVVSLIYPSVTCSRQQEYMGLCSQMLKGWRGECDQELRGRGGALMAMKDLFL